MTSSHSEGHSTQSSLPLRDLKTVWEPWLVSSNTTVWRDYGVGHMTFSTVSAVCYLYGAALSDSLGPDVPIGLISDNWGGQCLLTTLSRHTLPAENLLETTAGLPYGAVACCVRLLLRCALLMTSPRSKAPRQRCGCLLRRMLSATGLGRTEQCTTQ